MRARPIARCLSVATGLITALAPGSAARSATCGVSTAAVNFGSYDPLGTSDRDGVGRVTLSCDSAVSYTVSLGTGGGTYASRKLASGADVLRYNLYTDPGRTSVWGDGSGGSASASQTGSASLTVYGRIPGGQNVPPGSYGDLTVVTVSY